MTHDHENPICASLGHFVGGVTVAWCPHLSAWTMVVRAGDETDDTTWRHETVRFGPFDSDSDVETHVLSEMRRILRADRSGWAGLQSQRQA